MKRVLLVQENPVVVQASKPECSLSMYSCNGYVDFAYHLGWDSKKYRQDDIKEVNSLINELKRMKKTMEKYS